MNRLLSGLLFCALQSPCISQIDSIVFTVDWAQQFSNGNSAYFDEIVKSGDSLFVAGQWYQGSMANQLAMAIDAESGGVMWEHYRDCCGDHARYGEPIIKNDKLYFFGTQNGQGSSYFDVVFVEYDPQTGSEIEFTTWNYPGSNSFADVGVNSSGEYVILSNAASVQPLSIYEEHSQLFQTTIPNQPDFGRLTGLFHVDGAWFLYGAWEAHNLPGIIKLDENLSIEWSQTVGENGNRRVFCGLHNENQFVLAGRDENLERGFVVVSDLEGNLESEIILNPWLSNYSSVGSIAKYENGYFLTLRDFDSSGATTWLLALNESFEITGKINLGEDFEFINGSISGRASAGNIVVAESSIFISGYENQNGFETPTLFKIEWAPAMVVPGCTDPTACNFDAAATSDDGNCIYAAYGRDCDGNCIGGTHWYVDSSATGDMAFGGPESPFSNIQDALDIACPSDTIHIASGTYVENVNITTANVTLIGDEGFDPMQFDQTAVIVDANNAGSGLVLDATDTHVIGLTFTNGNANHGGAVYATNNGYNSVLDRCAIVNNNGLDLVTSHAHNLALERCAVLYNSGRNTIVPWSTASFNCCRIQYNSTPDNSNAILAAGENTQIVNCLIGPNESKGVYAYGASLLIENTTITGHTGGCVVDAALSDASIYMVNSVVTANDQDLVVNQASNHLAQFHIASSILDNPLDYEWESAYSTIAEYGTNLTLPALLEEDFSLASTSAAIGVAISELNWTGPEPNEPVIDITGAARPQPAGTAADLGAFEHPLGAPEPTMGCTEPTACNYNPTATDDDGTCIAPTCDDPSACNYDPGAICGGGECIPSGCMETLACNYNALAECEGEACDYTCCPGPGCCADGTSWDYGLGQCVPDGTEAPANSCPQDLDFDGVVGVGDLMDLLSVFGTNCPTNFTCGDPFNYHGYDYATVQIGEQCWFAENLRTSLYNNDDAIPSNLSDEEWSSTTSGAVAVYGEDTGCEDYSPDGDPCDPAWSLNEYGRLYNWHAVEDERGLCPNGWHIPSDAEWMTLEIELGLSETQANEFGSRGDHGIQMKTTYGWLNGGNGNNLSGYSGLPGGYRYNDGLFKGAGDGGSWWSSTTYGSVIWYRSLGYNGDTVFRSTGEQQLGFSIRCLLGTE